MKVHAAALLVHLAGTQCLSLSSTGILRVWWISLQDFMRGAYILQLFCFNFQLLHLAQGRMRARMQRALQRLTSDIYAEKVHVMLELIQNADDNYYLPNTTPALALAFLSGAVFPASKRCITRLMSRLFVDRWLAACCNSVSTSR